MTMTDADSKTRVTSATKVTPPMNAWVEVTLDVLRGELERLFTLEELTSMTERLLGLDPAEVGGQSAKGSFARALAERCYEGERLDALVDVVLLERREVDPRVRDLNALLAKEETLPAGKVLGPFTLERKIGESAQSIVYQARRDDGFCALKVLRREASRDRRAVQRFLTANRVVATVKAEGLPRKLEAGEFADGTAWVAYEWVAAQTLASRFAKTGPSHVNELKVILRGVLEPLAALHKAGLAHGAIKLENVLVDRAGEGAETGVVLVDAATDRLRFHRHAGDPGFLALFGSPKSIAPEIIRGKAPDPRSDVYAFGAMVYELLVGKPPLVAENPTDAVIAHLIEEPVAPSERAPRGWVTRDIDDFVLSLLHKDAAQRPRDAQALLEPLEGLGRASTAMRAAATTIPDEKLEDLVDALIASPGDTDAALALDNAVDLGASPDVVAEAFEMAADGASVSSLGDEWMEATKALLHRAARIFDTRVKNKERAEKVYEKLVALDPKDEVGWSALEEVRRSLGKHEVIVEMLLERSEAATTPGERARALTEIGRICAAELDDVDQALVAYTQALCETPLESDIAREIERLAGANAERWKETLETLAGGSQSETLSATERNVLLSWAGRWYDQKLGRADTALLAYQQIIGTDPANDSAVEGLGSIYRRAQQWPELAALLLTQSDAAVVPAKGRDKRTEAAELFETKLNDFERARELYGAVLAEDPGHSKAGDGLARIAERTGDIDTLLGLLERRAEARRGPERAAVLAKLAEAYEDQKNDLNEAARRYEGVLAIDPSNVEALKGLDRIFNRTGRYRELLDNLERQVDAAATPRQKIQLWERIAALHDEEFLDHESAAFALESILAIDPQHDTALTALARHYRALDRWDDAVKLLAKHAETVGDGPRKVDLLAARARILAEQVGSPERAMRAYEEVLDLSPDHAGALEALARLREVAGDAHAAISAIEALAAKAATPEAKAEQWLRAARLLEARGDKDGAIERYQAALEANPRDGIAALALRQAWKVRGDATSVVNLIERELSHAEGDLAKARLHGELARLYHEEVEDELRAEASAKRAIDLDPTNADALLVLGDVAFAHERFLEAARAYEPVIGRATTLKPSDAARVLVNFMEAFGRSYTANASATSSTPDSSPGEKAALSRPPPAANHPRMLAAVEALRRVAPDDVEALLRVSKVVFEYGDPRGAIALHRDLLDRAGDDLSTSDRADALYRLGESARRADDLDTALAALEDAADLDQSSALALQSLAWLYETREDWENVVRCKKRRLEVAPGSERFDLLLEIGDIEFSRLEDRTRASKTYVAALEERPDDRKLLTKLMQLYSEEKDWARLVDVVLRLADFVEDRKQRAKYMHTAAIVSSRQLGETDQALAFYERALEFDPTLAKARDEAIELRKAKGDHEQVEKLLNARLERAKTENDRALIVKTLDELGSLYQRFLGEPEMAIDAYEAAQAFDPEERQRAERLAELYASDVKQYLDKAVRAQTVMLRRNPYRVESYKLLRRLYTEAKKADPAWCVCQALSVMNLAEPDEERFYRRHRGDGAAQAQAAVTEEDWTERLAHADLDPLLTKIFAMIQPTIIRARTKPLAQLGYEQAYAIDTGNHPYPISQTLYYAQGVLGLPAAPVFQNPNDHGGLGFVHAHTPAVVLGRAALEAQVAPQAMAYVAGRHLTYFRPGYYVRHLVPTGTGLKAWLFAAIKMSVPQFPVTPDLQGQVAEATTAMTADFQGMQREKLASLVSKLLQAGGALDLKKWVSAIDLTADRAGLLLAHDLAVSAEVMRATEEGASVPVKDRMKEIVLFSVSEEYFELRDKLQIRIDS
jgi:tetratricopeptide (TPR) repeat protein